MPPSRAKQWFITISTRQEEDVPEEVVQSMVQTYHQYYVVKEYGRNGSHPHYHVCIWGQVEERQDVIRQRWIKFLGLQEQQHAVKVTPIINGNQLIGKYLNKDELMKVICSNIPDDIVTRLRDVYSKVEKVKPTKVKQISYLDAADAIISYCKPRELPLDNRQDMLDAIVQMATEGLRIGSSWTRLRHLWNEIQANQGVRLVEQDVFGNF